MPDEIPDNPAARLVWLLEGMRQASGGTDIQKALANVIGVHPDDLVSVSRAATEASMWPAQIAALLERVPGVDKGLYMSWEGNVTNTLVWLHRWGNAVENLTNQYNDATITALTFVAELLHREQPEPTISADGLAELDALVQETITATLSDDQLAESAKLFLLARLEEVHAAIRRFRVCGYKGVEEAMDTVVGTVVRRDDLRNERTVGRVSRLWQKLLSVAQGIGVIAGSAESATRAIEAGKDMFS